MKRSSKTALSSVIALPHTPPYKIHRYFARRPWNVFKAIIETYTSPGDIILDPFMGGGVTIYEGLRLGRNVIGYDLNPLSHFIVNSMIQTNLNTSLVTIYFEKIITIFTEKIRASGEEDYQDILWRELTYAVECNHCGAENLISNKFKVGIGKYRCVNKKCKSKNLTDPSIQPKNCKRLGMRYLFSVRKSNVEKSVSMNIDTAEQKIIGERVNLLAHYLDVEAERTITTPIPKNWDRQKEDLLEQKGFINFEDFFTPTNLVLNLGLKKIIRTMEMPENYRNFFRLVFSSSLRDTNVMTFTNSGWQGGKPTTWSRHAYWIPSQFCEVNVVDAFTRAFKRSVASLKYSMDCELNAKVSTTWIKDENYSAYIINGNLAESELPSNSVDAIITDPPYGSNVQYLELSHFWFPWNMDLYDVSVPNFRQEAISNRKKNFDGAKSMLEYEENLHAVFQKSYQVLRPGGIMSLTFNNKDMGAWLALLISIFKCGFTLSQEEIYFQDGVKNYKQTSHTRTEGSPYGDFIYIFRKPKRKARLKKIPSINQFILEMDGIFLFATRSSVEDRYEAQLRCFTRSIDLIKSISTISLSRKDKDIIFTHFHKKYLGVFFEKN